MTDEPVAEGPLEWTVPILAQLNRDLGYQRAKWLIEAWAEMAGFKDTMDRVQRTMLSIPKQSGRNALAQWFMPEGTPRWEHDIAERLEETPIYVPGPLERAREELAAQLAEHPVHAPRGREVDGVWLTEAQYQALERARGRE
jgi:hypothetical protein